LHMLLLLHRCVGACACPHTHACIFSIINVCVVRSSFDVDSMPLPMDTSGGAHVVRRWRLQNMHTHLRAELCWLTCARDQCRHTQEPYGDDALLAAHLNVAAQMAATMSGDERAQYACGNEGWIRVSARGRSTNPSPTRTDDYL
jgi:hypothetical protein